MRAVLIFFVATIAAALQTGCASTKAAPFSLMKAKENVALVYVFRPKEDATGFFSKPEFLVDNKLVAELPRKSLTIVSLEPGTHLFTLSTPDSKDSVWNAETSISFEAGRHFVAVWNQGQKTEPGTTVSIFLRPGVFLPIPVGGKTAAARVNFEVVPEELAVDSLGNLESISANTFAPPTDRLIPSVNGTPGGAR